MKHHEMLIPVLALFLISSCAPKSEETKVVKEEVYYCCTDQHAGNYVVETKDVRECINSHSSLVLDKCDVGPQAMGASTLKEAKDLCVYTYACVEDKIIKYCGAEYVNKAPPNNHPVKEQVYCPKKTEFKLPSAGKEVSWSQEKTETRSLCRMDQDCAIDKECKNSKCEQKIPKGRWEFINIDKGWINVLDLPTGAQAHLIVASEIIDVTKQLPIDIKLFVADKETWASTIKEPAEENCRGPDGCSIDGPYVKSEWEQKRLKLIALNEKKELLAIWSKNYPLKNSCEFSTTQDFENTRNYYDNTINSCDDATLSHMHRTVVDEAKSEQNEACKKQCEVIAKKENCACKSWSKVSSVETNCKEINLPGKKKPVYNINAKIKGSCFCSCS
ncbi:hypothetical protein HYV79_03050 [Candidatus Woesearchaeota archaeon]|nr:hypothetical protein [Candidatus Woesearchaeota archaeon]